MKAWNWLLGNLVILATGCGVGVVHSPMQDDSGPQGALSFLMFVDDNLDDLTGFTFTVDSGDESKTEYKELHPGVVPGDLLPEGASDSRRVADSYMVLSEGTYLVTVTPMQSEGVASTMCQAVQTSVEVVPDLTTEVLLVMPCKTDDTGGLDVVITTNHYPVIKKLVFSPDNHVAACENVQVNTLVEDVDGDELELDWQITNKPDGADPTLTELEDGITFSSDVPGVYEVQLIACDAFELCTELLFPITVLATSDNNQNGLDDACEPDLDKMGRVVTILLTMSNQRFTENHGAVSTTLASNAIDWVSPVDTPRVLLVLDDNNRGEYPDDANNIFFNLAFAGYDVLLVEEPIDGLLPEDLIIEGEVVDVVWFSNPGYQIDDLTTIETLSAFVDSGGGLVLQGDDMSWRQEAIGLTHLEFVNNGTRNCGQVTDNDSGASYLVDIVSETHPVIDGLEGITFPYGDDIDKSIALNEGEKVLAWTSSIDGTCPCEFDPRPVIIALDLEEIRTP